MKKVDRSTMLFTLSVLILLTLSMLVSRFSYAFLEDGTPIPSKTEGKVISAEDKLIFKNGEKMELKLDSSLFTKSQILTSTPSVQLIANDQTKNARGVYSVGINISNNTFNYAQENSPELILTVKGPNKEEIKPEGIGLNYVTVTDSASKSISGYDITNQNGIFNFVVDKLIETTDSTTGTTDEYEFTITFVHYEYDQGVNETASLAANVYISDTAQEATVPSAASYSEIEELPTVEE